VKRPAPGALAALAAIAVLTACSEPAPPDPARQARCPFELARLDEPGEDELSACFGPLRDDAARADLLDALAALRPAAKPEVVAEERLDDLALAVIDLAASLPGGGSARYSVHLERDDEDRWIIGWFRGPGVEWPRQRRPGGEGLSSSAVPE
jgi:hypothetical protein